MGEARTRRNLGLPPRTVRCPVLRCRSRRVHFHSRHSGLSKGMAKAWGSPELTTAHLSCLACGAVWEALPSGWNYDVVERSQGIGPCDNCAYRAGAKETADPEERRRIHEIAEVYASTPDDAPGRGLFCCHKGVPISIRSTEEGGLSFDYEAAGIKPQHQLCVGFMRIVWAENGATKKRREMSHAL